MKTYFLEPELNIVHLTVEDIIATSGEQTTSYDVDELPGYFGK